MEIIEHLDLQCRADDLFEWVSDLGKYTQWLGIVERAEPEATSTSSSDAEPAWIVDLGARIGPFARSKRLRMVRTNFDSPHVATFERREADGREHGSWFLQAQLGEHPSDSLLTRLTMTLRYEGKYWGSILEPVLAREIEQSKDRLAELVSNE